MNSNKTPLNLIIVITIILVFSCKKNKTEDVKDSLFEARKENAIWCYYESNFMKDRIVFQKERKNREVDTNVCFINGLIIDTAFFGDTLEFTFYSFMGDSEVCLPFHGLAFNVFGFYPNSDTVCYRSNCDLKYDRKPYNDSIAELFEWRNILPMRKQKVLFRQFIIEHRKSLNFWLRCEAIKRGIL